MQARRRGMVTHRDESSRAVAEGNYPASVKREDDAPSRSAGAASGFIRRAAIAALAIGALAGCDQDTFDPKENWNYLVCTMDERKQPEHVAFAVREDGRAVAAYLRKVLSATVTPFEIVFEYYKDGHLAKWRISRTDGVAEMSDFHRIYRGSCVKADGAKF